MRVEDERRDHSCLHNYCEACEIEKIEAVNAARAEGRERLQIEIRLLRDQIDGPILDEVDEDVAAAIRERGLAP